MKRHLLNFLTLLSLLLCATFLALWVRSHFRTDSVSHARFTPIEGGAHVTQWSATVPKGTVQAGWRSQRLRTTAGPAHFRYGGWEWEANGPVDPRFPRGDGVTIANRLGFAWGGQISPAADGYSGRSQYIAFPLWAAVLVLGLVPAARAWRRMRRVPGGHCAGCGYDLRGNESGVCPECGRPAVTPPRAGAWALTRRVGLLGRRRSDPVPQAAPTATRRR